MKIEGTYNINSFDKVKVKEEDRYAYSLQNANPDYITLNCFKDKLKFTKRVTVTIQEGSEFNMIHIDRTTDSYSRDLFRISFHLVGSGKVYPELMFNGTLSKEELEFITSPIKFDVKIEQ